MTEPIYPFQDRYMDFFPKFAKFLFLRYEFDTNERKKTIFRLNIQSKKRKGQIQIQNVYQRKFHVQTIWFII